MASLPDFIKPYGVEMAHVILGAAAWLREEYVPGLISIGLAFALLLSCLIFLWSRYGLWVQSFGYIYAIDLATHKIAGNKNDENVLDHFHDLDQFFNEWVESNSKAQRTVGRAWQEYRETTIEMPDGIRNGVRPSVFFNAAELGVAPGIWRAVPGLFVSVGLFFTFFGLIAALHQTGKSLQGDEAAIAGALQELLNVASAKFIMSLTGLGCSIAFTIVLRFSIQGVDRRIGRLCAALEEKLSFVSLEDLATRQLEAITTQNDHMTKLNTELIAQLSQPLREELPQALGAAITETLAPILKGVSDVGRSGVEDMVKDLSKTLTGNLAETMNEASGKLESAGQGLETLIDRMGAQSGQMGTQMETAIEKLAQAAQHLVQAAQGFERTMLEAGNQAAMDTAEQIKGAGKEVAEGIGEIGHQIRDPLERIRSTLTAISDQIDASTERMVEFSQGIEQGTEAAGATADSLGKTAKTFQEAAQPIRDTVARLETAGQVNRLALDTTREILDTGRQSVEAALEGIRQALSEFQTVVNRYDQMDTNLGKAFETFQIKVVNANNTLISSHDNIAEKTAESLDRLREVVEQVEDFRPETPGV